MADWREAYTIMRVQGEQHTGGTVDLPHDTTIDRSPAAAKDVTLPT